MEEKMLESEKMLIEERRTKKKYSTAFKLSAVEKVINNPQASFIELANEIGVSFSALYSWYNKYKNENLVMTEEIKSKVLSDQELFFVRETIGAKERDKVRYCRQHGIPYEKLREWVELYKDERYSYVQKGIDEMSDNSKLVIAKLTEELKELRKKLKEIEQEKNKAIALLELKKKVDRLCETEKNEEDK